MHVEHFVLRFYIKPERSQDAHNLLVTVRAQAEQMGLPDVSLRNDESGPIIEVTGDEAKLRAFWSAARHLAGLGLRDLQPAGTNVPRP